MVTSGYLAEFADGILEDMNMHDAERSTIPLAMDG